MELLKRTTGASRATLNSWPSLIYFRDYPCIRVVSWIFRYLHFHGVRPRADPSKSHKNIEILRRIKGNSVFKEKKKKNEEEEKGKDKWRKGKVQRPRWFLRFESTCMALLVNILREGLRHVTFMRRNGYYPTFYSGFYPSRIYTNAKVSFHSFYLLPLYDIYLLHCMYVHIYTLCISKQFLNSFYIDMPRILTIILIGDPDQEIKTVN